MRQDLKAIGKYKNVLIDMMANICKVDQNLVHVKFENIVLGGTDATSILWQVNDRSVLSILRAPEFQSFLVKTLTDTEGVNVLLGLVKDGNLDYVLNLLS